MTLPPDLLPRGSSGGGTSGSGGGGVAQVPSEGAANARLTHHIAQLPMQNTAVCIPSFARRAGPTAVERAVVDIIAECSAAERERRRQSGILAMGPPRAVVVFVSHESRAKDIYDLFRTHDDIRACVAHPPRGRGRNGSLRNGFRGAGHSKSSPGSNRDIESMFSAHDVIIVRDWHALEQFRSGDLSMFRISLLVFDEAECASVKAHNYSTIMREFYRCLTKNQRPRVFAIATVRDDTIPTAAIESNLYSDFPSENKNGPVWTCNQTFGERHPYAVLADVEYLSYQQQSVMRNAEASHTSQLSDYDFLVGELGNLAVVTYQKMFLKRWLSSTHCKKRGELPTNEIPRIQALHGLTPKALSFLHVLQKEYAASTDTDKLMAIVHAGRPVVAVALHGIIADLPGFNGMVCRVIIGDEDCAKPVERSLAVDEEQRGWQGVETDDEAVDDFGAGDANVLIVASSNIDRISRSRRPLPPCPLIIRFDGSSVDPYKDGGGGRCRVIVFKPQRYSGPLKRSDRKRRRTSAPVAVNVDHDVEEEADDADEDDDEEELSELEELSKPSGSNLKPPDLPNGAEAPREEPMEQLRATDPPSPAPKPPDESPREPSPVKLDPGAAPVVKTSSKKRKRPAKSSKKQKVVRFSENEAIEKVKLSAGAEGEPIANTVRTASALVGPQPDGNDECYLYGLRLQHARDENNLPLKELEICNPGGIEDYGIILTRKLSPRDLNVAIGDLGLLCRVDNKVGTLGLVCMGPIRLSPVQITKAQQFMMSIFSSLMKDIDRHSFRSETGQESDTPIDMTYLRNYLVVPIIRQDGSGLPSDSESQGKTGPRKYPPVDPAQVSGRGRINWDQVTTTFLHVLKETNENNAELFHAPRRGPTLDEHMEGLENNLVHVICGRRILLAGDLRYDQSPLSYIVRHKKFALNADGTIKPDKDIASLINTVEEDDPEGLTEKSPFFLKKTSPSKTPEPSTPKKSDPKPTGNTNDDDGVVDVIDLTSDADENLKTVLPKITYPPPAPPSEKEIGNRPKISTHGPPQRFSAYRNRLKKRKHWVGNFLQTHEDYQMDTRKIHIKTLDQPLLTTMDPPGLTLEHFIDSLRGVPVKKILSDYVGERGQKTRSVVPELCRLHPVSVGAMFLPPCLMALERHVLLCELRDIFADKVDVPIQLKLFAQAVTSTVVDPAWNYERLELLGDSVLKFSSTLRIFTEHPHYNEGKMHDKRASIVSNEALREKARMRELEKFMCFEQQYVENWKPPGCDREGRVVVLNSKSLADVVEALCGVFYLSGSDDYQNKQKSIVDLTDNAKDAGRDISGRSNVSLQCIGAIKRGYEIGVKMLEAFGVFSGNEPTHREVLLSAVHSLHPKGSPGPTEIVPEAFPRDPRLARPKKPWEEEFGPLEELLGYKFKRRHLLMCALTHGSYIDLSFESKTMSETFQRMEFLGDAIVDFFVVLYLYDTYPLLGPGELTELKGLVVSNETFARVSVQHGLHKYLFMRSEVLMKEIARFEDVVREELLEGDAMLQVEEVGSCAAPKVLGDVFEAILGAIMVDSGIEAAWNVSMMLLKETLVKRADPGKTILHPTRKLEILVMQTLRITQTQPAYEHRKVRGELDRFECEVKIVGHVIACERANSKKRAQLLVARTAHSRLSSAEPGSADAKLINELRMKATKIAVQVSRNVQ